MIPVRTVKLHPDAIVPTYGTKRAAGADLYACESLYINSGKSCLVSTGIALEIPEGFEGQIRPRSGMAFKEVTTVLNSPGTIDSDYRGEIKVLLICHGAYGLSITKGQRIAQLVIAPVHRAEFQLVDTLDQTVRGDGGFGSTGK